MKRLVIIGTMAVMATAGCKHEGSAVQKQYAADRTECRQYAEQTVSAYGGAFVGEMPTGREHVALVEQFARCMHKRGWAVNKPPKDKNKSD
ncbi:MAG: hypothetical protein MK052_03250 [Alphaproteobacteria bacterium]|nr:hypothetical protein [Alphaproteobacteria bacterium]